jgi:putative drug exporter of the RND superfamily
MTSLLYRLGRSSALHPWRALVGWLAFTALLLGLAAGFGGRTQDDYDVPDAPAQQGLDLLRAHLPGAGNANARLVVHTPHGRIARGQLQELDRRLAEMPHVATVREPVLSPDRDTALVVVDYDVPVTDRDLMGNVVPLEKAVEPSRDAGLQVEMNGAVPESAAAPMEGRGELVGIVAALLILLLAFGSVVGAGLPIGTAVAGLAAGSGGLTLLAQVTDVSTAAPTVATMVGLGVGIDYALLLATRHVEYLRAGHDVVESAARATATAGRSVVFAGLTVLVSLMGLRLARLSAYSSFGFATAIAVVCVLTAALVLVPALCRLAGRRLLPRKVRRTQPPTTRPPLTARWAAVVGRRPLPWALAAAALMTVLAIPALDMHTWPQDPSTASSELTTRKAFDLITEEYGAGANTSVMVVADRAVLGDSAVADLRNDLLRRHDVVAVSPAQVSPDGAIAVLDLQPAYAAIDDRTAGMVSDLRADLPQGALLTGDVPLFADISGLLADRLPVVIAFVVGVSVLLLAMVFRSVVVPLKAAVMNLLSIGAAYGVLTAVFQWGWGAGLFGLDQPVPVSSWVPILIFAILFGLSMDYEVFLLSRIREDWLSTGDAHGSVVRGLAGTGRVISAAAAIMVAVFLGFASEVDVIVKMLGLGMAVAILLDATVVRMVLVPATMTMLGRLNWWIPRWLDRLLPGVAVEPQGVEPAPTTVGATVGASDPDDARRLVGV